MALKEEDYEVNIKVRDVKIYTIWLVYTAQYAESINMSYLLDKHS